MGKRVAVILSGCGFLDGAEIHESVLTLLNLDLCGADYECFAPNKNQAGVTNHVTKEPANETRNVMVESARIARCEISDVKELKVDDFDALVLPGGFGAALNLCDFGVRGAESTVDEDVARVVVEFNSAKKPIGAICIAPALISRVLGQNGVELTIGHDADTAAAIEASGAKHINRNVDEVHFDESHKVLSTPAYMLGPKISDVNAGISKLVKQLVEIA